MENEVERLQRTYDDLSELITMCFRDGATDMALALTEARRYVEGTLRLLIPDWEAA